MLRRVLQVLAILGVLLLGVVALGPFLVSTAPLPGLQPAGMLALPASQFVDIPFPGTTGLSLHYLEDTAAAGAGGQTFILLHGFTFNAFTWDRVRGSFAGAGRVVAYDQIPYGLSAKPTRDRWQGPNPYSKEAAITQLFAFMDALGIDRATLIGNSSGGTLAMEAALARPQRVTRLVLVAPWVYARRPTLPVLLAELPQMRRLSLLLARKLGQGVLLDPSYLEPARIDAERRWRMRIHTGVENWDLAWGELLQRSLSSPVTVARRLESLAQPVLLITGEQDRLVPVADTVRVAERLPGAVLEVLRGCGHAPQEECPEAFRAAVSNWLNQGRAD